MSAPEADDVLEAPDDVVAADSAEQEHIQGEGGSTNVAVPENESAEQASVRRVGGVVEIAVAVHEEQKHVSVSQIGAGRNPYSAEHAVLVAERQGPSRMLGHEVEYQQTIDAHLKPMLGMIQIRELTGQHVQVLIGKKVEEGLSPRTIRGIRAVLRSALSDAVKWRVVPFNAATAASLPRASRVDVRVFTPEEARKFLAEAESDRLGAIFSVALAVGLRLGEALGLRWIDVDLERSQLHVRQALQRIDGELRFVEPQSEQSRRTVALPDLVATILKRHRTRQLEERLKAGSRWKDQGLVFTTTIGTPLDERNVRRAFCSILRRAELPTIRIHDLRHTCASLLLVQGVHPRIVMETLGHSQISLTMDTYSHVLPALQQEAARQIDSLLAAKS